MSQQYDGFGDIIERETGIFGEGGGLKAHEGLRHQYTADGVVVELSCTGPVHGGCGKPKHVTIAWQELIAIKYNVSPHEVFPGGSQWAPTKPPTPHAWYPTTLRCSRCQEMVAPLVEPRECDGHLRNARRNGWVDQQVEGQVSQRALQAAQRLGRV
jgi:hypothetical protein